LLSIDYFLWQAWSGQKFIVYVGGAAVYTVPGSFAAGDVGRIERVGNTIHFKVNGVSVFDTTEISSGPLYADMTINRTGHLITGLTLMTGPPQRVADVRSYSDYYPYGWAMVGRNTNPADYRFGMNGMEMDNAHKGDGASYTSFFRQYDPRLGRWLSKDPVTHPWQSPYNAFDANPILFADPSGAEGWLSNVVSQIKGFISQLFGSESGSGGGTEFGGFEQICDGCGAKGSPVSLETFEFVDQKSEAVSSSHQSAIAGIVSVLSTLDFSTEVHVYGNADQDPGVFPEASDPDVHTTDMGWVEDMMAAASKMKKSELNWRDAAKKHKESLDKMEQWKGFLTPEEADEFLDAMKEAERLLKVIKNTGTVDGKMDAAKELTKILTENSDMIDHMLRANNSGPGTNGSQPVLSTGDAPMVDFSTQEQQQEGMNDPDTLFESGGNYYMKDKNFKGQADTTRLSKRSYQRMEKDKSNYYAK